MQHISLALAQTYIIRASAKAYTKYSKQASAVLALAYFCVF